MSIIEASMSDSIFIGRKVELERLMALHKKKIPSLVIVKGRRRIEKSRLIIEFAKTTQCQNFWSFAGLAPKDRARTLSEIRQSIEFARSGTLSKMMEHLIIANSLTKNLANHLLALKKYIWYQPICNNRGLSRRIK